VNANRRMCDELADSGCSSERRIGLLPPRQREPATWMGPGIAEIAAMVGGLIRQGSPLPVVLTSLCQLFEATVKGFSGSILLRDGTGAQEAAPAAAPGLRLHEVSPILSLTGEPLGIFAIYQRESNPDVARCHSALIPQFTQLASAAIERMRSDEALKRSAALLERTQQLEEALAKLRAELARAARVTSLGVLTAAIAHEVNQPLAGIVTNASTCRRMLAVDPPDVEGARETARRTIRDAERASEVVKRLHALFCKKGATSESLDLNEATLEVVALSLSEVERNKVIVRTELAGELPRVQGDRVQLQQVILNLFLNASDAMSGVDDRPRQLVIKTERDEEDRVRLSVRDTGVGFEPLGMDRLFDAFYTTKSNGMGIGLSVSRSIIESHKGRLWATLNDGPGATFSFSIPCGCQDATAGVACSSHSATRLCLRRSMPHFA
jgi:signal transduction histidine kinase